MIQNKVYLNIKIILLKSKQSTRNQIEWPMSRKKSSEMAKPTHVQHPTLKRWRKIIKKLRHVLLTSAVKRRPHAGLFLYTVLAVVWTTTEKSFKLAITRTEIKAKINIYYNHKATRTLVKTKARHACLSPPHKKSDNAPVWSLYVSP